MLRILIPVYNEEKNIKRCIRQVIDFVPSDYKIYVVDDGSQDQSPQILAKLAKRAPLKIITHKTNLGVSEALKTGLREVISQGDDSDAVVIMEGDGTSDPSILPKMLEKIKNGCDLVIASRYAKGGGYRQFPPLRKFYSLLANFVFRLLFPHQGVSDYTIFYRGYRLRPLKKAYGAHGGFINSRYFVANTEILLKLLPHTRRVCEIPFLYDYGLKKGRSSLNVTRNVGEYIRFIVRTKLDWRAQNEAR